jgi:dienelactone hydrolase
MFRRIAVLLAALVVCSAAGGRVEDAQVGWRVVLRISPSAALVDAPVDIRVAGVPARSKVQLLVSTRDAGGAVWAGSTSYTASGAGVLDTRGSSRPFVTLSGPKDAAYSLPSSSTPVSIRVSVHGRVVAAGSFERRGSVGGVSQTQLTYPHDGLVGSFAAPPQTSAGAAPGVLILGGSGGGTPSYLAAVLASHGYPSLALAYFGEPGLPANLEDVPLEYFAAALRWLAGQPGVDALRLVVVGASRGGEAALLLAAKFPTLVSGVVAASTPDQVLDGLPSGNAWTLGGRPVTGPIPIESITQPVLLFAGGDDAVVGQEAVRAAASLAYRSRAAGHHNVTALIYPRAGHGVLDVPNLPIATEIEVSPHTFIELGGAPIDNGAAHAASWKHLLAFLNAAR